MKSAMFRFAQSTHASVLNLMRATTRRWPMWPLMALSTRAVRRFLERRPTENRSLSRRNVFHQSMVIAAHVTSVCLVAHGEEAKPITYDDHIAMIFKKHCLQCHGDSKQEAGLNLANYLAIRKGGSGGEVVFAGRSSSSRLFQAITAEDPEARMPPKNDPLAKEQIALIKSWIDTGLRQSSGSSPVATRTLGFTPTAGVKSDGPPPIPENLPAIESARLIRPFPVLALAASPRASLVAVASNERIDFVDPLTRKVIGSVPFTEGEPHVLRFNRSGSVLVLPLAEHKASVSSLSWRSDSQVLVSSGEDGLIAWWDVAKGWPAFSKSDAHPPQRPAGVFGKIANGVLDASFGPGGELVTCGRDRSVRVWASDGNLQKTFGPDSNNISNTSSNGIRILSLQAVLTFDGSLAVSGDSAGQLKSWPMKGDQKK